MVKRHLSGILRYWDSRLTSGAVEGINSKIQEVKRRAKGFRNIKHFIAMIYLVSGQLQLEDITATGQKCEAASKTEKV
jgi:hypothetical protein